MTKKNIISQMSNLEKIALSNILGLEHPQPIYDTAKSLIHESPLIVEVIAGRLLRSNTYEIYPRNIYEKPENYAFAADLLISIGKKPIDVADLIITSITYGNNFDTINNYFTKLRPAKKIIKGNSPKLNNLINRKIVSLITPETISKAIAEIENPGSNYTHYKSLKDRISEAKRYSEKKLDNLKDVLDGDVSAAKYHLDELKDNEIAILESTLEDIENILGTKPFLKKGYGFARDMVGTFKKETEEMYYSIQNLRDNLK